MKISIQNNKITYFAPHKSFWVSGKSVGFATTYEVENEKTGKTQIFFFDHSTGSEWDVNTMWIYKSKEGFTLNVTNSDVTEQMKQNYLEAKTRI